MPSQSQRSYLPKLVFQVSRGISVACYEAGLLFKDLAEEMNTTRLCP